MNKTSAAQSSTISVKEDINAAGPLRKSMARHSKLQDRGVLVREDFDGGPVSFDEIECGLFLGNLTAATNMEALKSSNITYILTLDSVPLPKHITEASFLTTKYIHIADIPKEDILHHLDSCLEFIKTALSLGNKILVHCYFGVSRSSSVVIAYLMKTYNLDYQQAFEMVKSKRRFVQPNVGFVAQLKLWHRMGYTIEPHCQKYKIYRLRLAGEQVRKAKILPQNFSNLIKADPAITQAKPEPIVYRCRKCRRILASKSHLLQHMVKNDNLNTAMAINDMPCPADQNPNQAQQSSTSAKLLLDIAAQLRNVSIVPSTTNSHLNNVVAVGQHQPQQQQSIVQSKYCESIIFVEPIAWMKHITHSTQGRLSCPKCEQKLGNFSWINGCQCPCGEEVSPAFYLIPSKVELSKAVQNVQTTL